MIKKITLAVYFLLTASSSLFAQYNLDWMQASGNNGKYGVMSTVDAQDNLIICGHSSVASQIYIRKYSISGTFIWEANDTSTQNSLYEHAHWINCDANNNILVVGSIGAYSTSPTAAVYLVALKYSAAGVLIWRTTIQLSPIGTAQNYFDCRSAVDAAGNLYVGTAISVGATLYKLDPNGTVLFTSSSTANAPMTFASMRLRNNKVAIVTGSPFGANTAPIFVWDTSGTLLWTADAVGQGAYDVEIDENENFYVFNSQLANFVSPTSQSDLKITKYSSTGSVSWVHYYDFGGNDFPTRLAYLNHKISAIGFGGPSIDWITFQIDTSGTLQWSAIYDATNNNDEYPYYVLPKPNGEVIVTGKGGPAPIPFSSFIQMPIVHYSNTGVQNWVGTPNMYGGWGTALAFASDSSLFAISTTSMTAYHYNSAPTDVQPHIQPSASLNVFPNPFQTQTAVEVNLTSIKNCSFKLYDCTAKEIYFDAKKSILFEKNKIILALSGLENGIYFFSINMDEDVKTIKLIKN